MVNYDYAAGVGAVVIVVPPGMFLSTVAAFATAAGATVQIDVGNLVPVPFPGSVSMDIQRAIQGPVNVTFVGTSGYLVDWFSSPAAG